MPAAVIQVNGTPGSRADIVLGATVTLTNQSNAGVVAWAWSFIDKPEGSTASLTTPTASMSTFVADLEGTYLVQLQVNGGGGALTDQQYGSVLTLQLGLRIPAAGEILQENAIRGWAQSVNRLISKLERDQREGTIIAGISSAAQSAGVPVRLTALSVLSNGESLPVASAASASIAAQSSNLAWCKTSAAGAGAKLDLLVDGLVLTTLDTSAAMFGDPVFLTNAGGISLVAGTVPAVVGTVVTSANPGVIFVRSNAFGNVGTNQILDHAVTQVKLALTIPTSTVYNGSNPNAGFDNIAGTLGDILVNYTLFNGFMGWKASVTGAPATWVPFGRCGNTTNKAVSYQVLSTDQKVRVTSTAAARTITFPDVTTIPIGFDLDVMDASFANTGNNTLVVGHAGELINGNASFTLPGAGSPGIPADGTGRTYKFTWNGTTIDVS